jgi:hypothetical protein
MSFDQSAGSVWTHVSPIFLSLFVGTGDECSIETGIRFAMLVVDTNGDATGSTTSQVSDASACTTRSINEAWSTSIAGSEVDISMKRALRQGDAHVLNIYFTTLDIGLLGYAYLPAGYVTNRILDGVSVTDTAIVGGSSEFFNEGVSRFEKK